MSDRRRSCSPVFCDLTLAATHPPISFSSILTVLFSPLLSSPLLSSLYSRFLRGLSTPWSILYRPRLRRKPPSPSRALSWVDRFFVTYLFLKSFSLSLSLSLLPSPIGGRWDRQTVKYWRALMRLNYGYGVNILSNHAEVSLLFVPFLSGWQVSFRVLLFFLRFQECFSIPFDRSGWFIVIVSFW